MSTLISTYSWIFCMIILNYGIITVNSVGLLALMEFELDLLMFDGNSLLNNQDSVSVIEESEEMTMAEFSSRIDRMEKTIMRSNERIIDKLRHLIKQHSAIRDFSKAVTYINYLFELFKEYGTGYKKRTLKDIAELCVTVGDNGLIYKLNDLTETVSPSLRYATSLFRLAIGPYQTAIGAVDRCDETESLQQEILNMYREVGLYLIKGYTMISHAYDILEQFDLEEFAKERELIIVHYKQAMHRIRKSAVSALNVASRDIRSCDPSEDEGGQTYIELKWLFNEFVAPESVLAEGWTNRMDTSWNSCKDIQSASLNSYKNPQWDESVKCYGDIYNCSFQAASHYCAGTANGRRYDAVAYLSELKQSCANPVHVFTNRPSQEMTQKETCSCACDDYNHPKTVRMFSLALVEADTKRNRVITGLRFVEKYKAIYIQIQQGKLKPNGSIVQSSIEWKPIDVTTEFWSVKWTQKTVNLDTLAAPADQVMTGIKFSVLNANLRLTIRTHQYDYEKGVYLTGNDFWISKNITDRTMIELVDPDSPIYAEDENIVTVGKNLCINFQMTDLTKNLSQTAIPFLDAQEIISYPPRPLSGAGLYFKGQEEYGGFIGLNLVAYDYAVVLARQQFSEGQLLGVNRNSEDTSEEIQGNWNERAEGEMEKGTEGEREKEAGKEADAEDANTQRDQLAENNDGADQYAPIVELIQSLSKKKSEKQRGQIRTKGRKRNQKLNKKRHHTYLPVHQKRNQKPHQQSLRVQKQPIRKRAPRRRH